MSFPCGCLHPLRSNEETQLLFPSPSLREKLIWDATICTWPHSARAIPFFACQGCSTTRVEAIVLYFGLSGQVSKNPHKQASLGECGGVAVLLEVCASKHATESRLLVPVLWGLRNCLYGNAANKNRFVRAGGLEALVQVIGNSVMKEARNKFTTLTSYRLLQYYFVHI